MEGFRLDRRVGCLFRVDETGLAAPVAIGSRALGILGLLVERKGELVLKDAILNAVWPGIAVEESNLTVQISALRRILDRDRKQGSCIQTIFGRGYCFVAPVKQSALDVPSPVLAALQTGEPKRPHLSIVVLPFINLSDDRKQQYFADGITIDLTTDLSRIADMLVISRHTAFTYRDKPVDAKQIGRELGVRYIIEGSVHRFGNRVRVNAQLIDAEADTHLWADRFDCDISDLFSLQNEITSRIAVALDLELIGAEAARPSAHPDALDYILRGRAVGYGKTPTSENYRKAIGLFEQALAIDPRSVEAQAWLANALAMRVLDQMTCSPEADIVWAEGLIGQALAASPGSPQAHFAKAQLLRVLARFEEAILEYEAVLAFNRNWVFAIAALGWCKLLTGSIDEATRLYERAMSLSPRDPYIVNWYYGVGLAHLLQSRLDEAIVWYEKARHAAPSQSADIHAHLASALALNGETERAAAELKEARRLGGDGRYSSLACLTAAGYFGDAKVRVLFDTTYLVGLRKAGMPEE